MMGTLLDGIEKWDFESNKTKKILLTTVWSHTWNRASHTLNGPLFKLTSPNDQQVKKDIMYTDKPSWKQNK